MVVNANNRANPQPAFFIFVFSFAKMDYRIAVPSGSIVYALGAIAPFTCNSFAGERKLRHDEKFSALRNQRPGTIELKYGRENG
jgi:hypothetical protein